MGSRIRDQGFVPCNFLAIITKPVQRPRDLLLVWRWPHGALMDHGDLRTLHIMSALWDLVVSMRRDCRLSTVLGDDSDGLSTGHRDGHYHHQHTASLAPHGALHAVTSEN